MESQFKTFLYFSNINLEFHTLEKYLDTYILSLNPLLLILLLPLFSLMTIFILNFSQQLNKNNLILQISLYLSGISFLASLILFFKINPETLFFQNIFTLEFSPLGNGHKIYFGIDYIASTLIVLTNLFIYLCILSIRFIEIKGKFTTSELINNLFFIQWGLIGAFSSLDLLSFFIFFEATLIPIFKIILQGGSRERRSRAGILIAIYTLLGSIFMLFNIIYLYNKYGTTNYLFLYTANISIEDQKILWITFFLTFAAKIPVFPFHIWLPEAHVEAPTIGSVLLAALLLKLGIYGLIRFGLPLFPYGQEYFKHIIVTLTICSFFYTNLTAIRQVDIKKIIAYSSVVHMNLIVLGILCLSVESLDGAIYQMLAHGIVSGALFFCIGIIYERFKTRFLWYYGGIAFILPLYSIYLFIFILANISFPMTSNFIGEMLLFIGIFKDNFVIGFFAVLSMFWGVIYNVWTYNRICFGNIKVNYTQFNKQPHSVKHTVSNFNKDIDKNDFYILAILTFLLLLTGIFSSIILDYVSLNSTLLVDKNFLMLHEYVFNSSLIDNLNEKKPLNESNSCENTCDTCGISQLFFENSSSNKENSQNNNKPATTELFREDIAWCLLILDEIFVHKKIFYDDNVILAARDNLFNVEFYELTQWKPHNSKIISVKAIEKFILDSRCNGMPIEHIFEFLHKTSFIKRFPDSEFASIEINTAKLPGNYVENLQKNLDSLIIEKYAPKEDKEKIKKIIEKLNQNHKTNK